MKLAAFFAVVCLGLAVACGGGGEAAPTAVIITETPTPSASPTATATPTPTPTPIPPPQLLLSTLEIFQGGTLLVTVTGDVAGGTVTTLGREYRLLPSGGAWQAFIGVGPVDPLGTFDVAAAITRGDGTPATLSSAMTVVETAWEVEYLEFTGEQAALLDPEIVAAETALLAEMYATWTPQRLWNDAWLEPVPIAVSSRFGQQRSVNGSAPSGHHGGTDLAADEFTPIVATNTGTVVLARPLQVRGNMVIVDHGGGVLSGYAHMNGFVVAEGQQVNAGDLLGYVGSTGLSTGPHLHWEMSVGGILVDALRFLDGSNGF